MILTGLYILRMRRMSILIGVVIEGYIRRRHDCAGWLIALVCAQQEIDESRFGCLPFPHSVTLELTVAGWNHDRRATLVQLSRNGSRSRPISPAPREPDPSCNVRFIATRC